MLGSMHYTFHWVAESQGNPATDPIVFWCGGPRPAFCATLRCALRATRALLPCILRCGATDALLRILSISRRTNGGPGCSGLYGMGFENGPFLAQQDGTLRFNPMSWNRFATVVWIEQPAGVGFSYSSNPNDYAGAYNDTTAASDNAAFLSAFFAQYPQYQSLDLYLTSESYGELRARQRVRAHMRAHPSASCS